MPAGSPEVLGSGDEATGGSSTVGAGDQELESPSLLPESQAECAQASAILSEQSESRSSSQTSLSTTRTKDSGFSESISSTSCCSLDPHAEKETTCEKQVRPEGKKKTSRQTLYFFCHSCYLLIHLVVTFFLLSEAAVTGYQQPSESVSSHASQFYIALLDSNNKEQRLDERGMTTSIFSSTF